MIYLLHYLGLDEKIHSGIPHFKLSWNYECEKY